MNTMTEKPEKTNIGSRVTVFSLARGKLLSGAMVGLTTAVLVAVATAERFPTSEYRAGRDRVAE